MDAKLHGTKQAVIKFRHLTSSSTGMQSKFRHCDIRDPKDVARAYPVLARFIDVVAGVATDSDGLLSHWSELARISLQLRPD